MSYSLKTLLIDFSFNCYLSLLEHAKESFPKTRAIYSAVSIMIKKSNYHNEIGFRNGCAKALHVLK